MALLRARLIEPCVHYLAIRLQNITTTTQLWLTQIIVGLIDRLPKFEGAQVRSKHVAHIYDVNYRYVSAIGFEECDEARGLCKLVVRVYVRSDDVILSQHEVVHL